MFDVDKSIYSEFYKLCSEFYYEVKNNDEFYSNSLQYLAYEDEVNLSFDKKKEIIYRMSLSCLAGEKMFDFVELIEKDYFKVIINTEYEWIYQLILAFNASKTKQFIELLERFYPEIQKEVT